MRHAPSLVVALVLLASVPGTVRALDLNAVTNPEFDDADGIADWTGAATVAHMTWNAEDADNCTASGGMLVDNTVPDSDSATVMFRNCTTNVTPGATYEFGARFKFTPGTSTSRAFVHVFASTTTTTCNGATAIASGPFILSSVSGWQSSLTTGYAVPLGTQSVEIAIWLVKVNQVDPKAEVLIDRVFFVPDGLIYAEDFEIGEPCRWNGVSP